MTCACMGPRLGEPLCPCRMEALKNAQNIKNEKFVLKGWYCGGCGRHHAPSVLTCPQEVDLVARSYPQHKDVTDE